MFGYVVANKQDLTPEQQEHYRACYCGLCRVLGQRYGTAGRMTLTYDMTFLILLLTSLYEPAWEEGSARCAAHPSKKHPYWHNEVTGYAAAMNVALAYYNCLDDWRDEKNLLGFSGARLLKPHYQRIREQYPRQCAAIERELDALTVLERAGSRGIDGPANCFGALMGELFVWREDRWADALRELGAGLGRYVYAMDAYEDVDKDIKRRRYNPLAEQRTAPAFRERCRDILTLFIGEGAAAFERLPLVEDLPLLRNILYSGVWNKYAALEAAETKRKGRSDGSL